MLDGAVNVVSCSMAWDITAVHQWGVVSCSEHACSMRNCSTNAEVNWPSDNPHTVACNTSTSRSERKQSGKLMEQHSGEHATS